MSLAVDALRQFPSLCGNPSPLGLHEPLGRVHLPAPKASEYVVEKRLPHEIALEALAAALADDTDLFVNHRSTVNE